MQLTSPCGNYGIPVFYRRNSLAIRCQVCKVQVEDKKAKVCKIFVKLPEDVDKVGTRRMVSNSGRPCVWTCLQEDFNSEIHEPELLDAGMAVPDDIDQEER